jgi:superfamily II DNA or RNA helicase
MTHQSPLQPAFRPGDLVRARGREWVATQLPAPDWLTLRPLTGGEQDVQTICTALEHVTHATFQPPEAHSIATQDTARLLAEALRLSLRSGAGPFRSAARVAFEPRAYQLVPLLMALRLPVIRLLIADDVGIGKTIEAGLIVREMLDRGEIDRFSVLCPPHLVDQWTGELRSKFGLGAVAITASSASRFERSLPAAETIFDAHPFTVVSLDYIKADRRRESFARSCPSLILVDEAHACVGVGGGRQQRFELLTRLAQDPSRHILLLTATPHSGNESAFDRLLALLDPSFAGERLDDEAFRKRLARHFVQRRRLDVTSGGWQDATTPNVFPEHKSSEITYNLIGPHQAFHDAIIDYCFGVVEGAGEGQQRRRLAFWGTLALMRCVGSSTAAALSALRNRAGAQADDLQQQLLDEDEETDTPDLEPDTGMGTIPDALAVLINQAEQLLTVPDPKLDATVRLLRPLIEKGARPVIFCRYLATADQLAQGLRAAFKKQQPDLRIEVVTGELTPDERRDRVQAMVGSTQRLLVATDCLSEGVNLQELFDTVVHYDLSWNPTRHQQREGRVDRFGQSAPVVHSALLYSPDSAIDGAVLEVILRKAEMIRAATGVTVPLPEKQNAIAGALMNSVVLHQGRTRQLPLDLAFDSTLAADAQTIDADWRNADEGERRSRSKFAQNTLKPAEVLPEWQRWRSLLGTPAEVETFVGRALGHMGAPLHRLNPLLSLAHLAELPEWLSEQIRSHNLHGTVPVVFAPPATLFRSGPAQVVIRNHPLTTTLADAILESSLAPEGTASTSRPLIGRTGAWFSSAVSVVTTVVLLRLRFKLSVSTSRSIIPFLTLAEEPETIAFVGTGVAEQAAPPILSGDAARLLLATPASANMAEIARDRHISKARRFLDAALPTTIAQFAKDRAAMLEQDHLRVREAARSNLPHVTVEPVLPPDIIGFFTLLPSPTSFPSREDN